MASLDLAARAARFLSAGLKARRLSPPDLAVVLGSGLGGLAAAISHPWAIPYGRIPGFALAAVPGHAGRLVFGKLAGRSVVAMQGRFHFYEGHAMERVVFPVRVFRRLGARSLLATSAVGGVAPSLAVGDLLLVSDHINLMGANPLRGVHRPAHGERFPDMSDVYSTGLRRLARRTARALGVRLKEGIYCAVSGPCYETPAEIRAFRRLGADVVGMSLAPEAVAARQERMDVLAVAWVSNKAAGLGGALSHQDVLAAGRDVEKKLGALLTALIARLP